MNAFHYLLKFFRLGRAGNRSARRRSVHLELECLDQRLLPSASMHQPWVVPALFAFKTSPNAVYTFNYNPLSEANSIPNPLSAVTDVSGSATGFYLDPTNAVLYQLRDSVASAIAPAGAVTQFVAGLNAKGLADVFAEFNGRIEVVNFDGHGWQDLHQPMQMAAFAAVDGGRAYFEGVDHSLWEYSPSKLQGMTYLDSGWTQLWSGNSVFSVWNLDAITERPNGINSGRDVVFAEGGDGRLEAFTQGGWIGIPGDINTGSGSQWDEIEVGDPDAGNVQPHFYLFSAGLDSGGHAQVYWTEPYTSQNVFYWDSFYGADARHSVVTSYFDGTNTTITQLSGTTDGKFFMNLTWVDNNGFNELGVVGPVEEWNDQGAKLVEFPGTSSPFADGAPLVDLVAPASPNTFFYHTTFWSTSYSTIFPNNETLYEYSGGNTYTYNINLSPPHRLAPSPLITTSTGTLAAAAFSQSTTQPTPVLSGQLQATFSSNALTAYAADPQLPVDRAMLESLAKMRNGHLISLHKPSDVQYDEFNRTCRWRPWGRVCRKS